MFKALKDNKNTLIASKKSETKNADALSFVVTNESNEEVNKSEVNKVENINEITVKIVINTTNLLDSHGDVHLKGIWNKSVSDNKNKGFLHLQEHNRNFSNIISDNAKGTVELMSWKELGQSFNGTTEALVFESKISKNRNPFMFEQYSNGWVKNHSVGMRYVSLDLAINSDERGYEEEKAVWDKYYNEIANKDQADDEGHFWVVKEAKIVEGSAVVMGSNYATPTLENKTIAEQITIDNAEAEKSLQTEREKELLKELLNKI
jgi:hypothetical protein